MPSKVLIIDFIPQSEGDFTNFIQNGLFNFNGLYIWGEVEYQLDGGGGNDFLTNEGGFWYFGNSVLGQVEGTFANPWDVTAWQSIGGDYTPPLSAYENMQVVEFKDPASRVLVSGANNYAGFVVNGVYNYLDLFGGRPRYVNDAQGEIYWQPEGSIWILRVAGDNNFVSYDNVVYPWLATTWVAQEGSEDVNITEYIPSTEPTYGLPAEVVALMVARQGSVANYLRMHNLGYI